MWFAIYSGVYQVAWVEVMSGPNMRWLGWDRRVGLSNGLYIDIIICYNKELVTLAQKALSYIKDFFE